MRELTSEELLLVTGGDGYTSIFDYVGYGPGDSLMTVAELAAALGNNTMIGARNDIRAFFTTGDHVLHAPGSVLEWQNMRVDWSVWGNGSMSPDQVLHNAYVHGATGNNPYQGGGGSGGGGGGGGGNQNPQ